MENPPTGKRAAAIGLGLLALLALAALGARGLPGGSGDGAPVRLDFDPTRVLGVAMGIFAGLTLLVLVWVLWPDGTRTKPALRPRRRTLGGLIMAAALIMGAVWLSRRGDEAIPVEPTGTLTLPAPDAVPSPQPGWGFDAWMLVVVLAASAAAAALLARSRTAPTPPVPPRPVRQPVGTPGAAGPTHPAEAGNRAAVIRAYAGMEDMLGADHSLPRRPWEAPDEYLARALPALGRQGSPARTLTALYQVARFSEHEIVDAMRRRADAALTDLSSPPGGGRAS